APLDVETILKSVAKTGRLVLVDQAPRHSSAAAIIAAEVAEHGFESLRAPISMVTALDTSIPYSEPLEEYVLPNEEKIVKGWKAVLAKRVVAVKFCRASVATVAPWRAGHRSPAPTRHTAFADRAKMPATATVTGIAHEANIKDASPRTLCVSSG